MASVADAEDTLRSTKEKANFQRLTRLLMCGSIKLLREKFDSCHSPADLPLKLIDPAIWAKLGKAKLSPPEWKILYPSPGIYGKSADFDITLTFRLLRTICSLTAPSTGWNSQPANTDHSIEADLVRIKCFRNSVYGHNSKMEMTDSDFLKLWTEIGEALLRIAGSLSTAKKDEWNKRIKNFPHDPLTPEAQKYAKDLKVWHEKDFEVKDSVRHLGYELDKVGSNAQGIRQDCMYDKDQIRLVYLEIGKHRKLHNFLKFSVNVQVVFPLRKIMMKFPFFVFSFIRTKTLSFILSTQLLFSPLISPIQSIAIIS